MQYEKLSCFWRGLKAFNRCIFQEFWNQSVEKTKHIFSVFFRGELILKKKVWEIFQYNCMNSP